MNYTINFIIKDREIEYEIINITYLIAYTYFYCRFIMCQLVISRLSRNWHCFSKTNFAKEIYMTEKLYFKDFFADFVLKN